MPYMKIIYILAKIKVLSPFGLYRLLGSIRQYGINVMALLSFAARTYGHKAALVDGNQALSYQQLLSQSEKLAMLLKERYKLGSRQKVGLYCRNHVSFITTIFAVSRLGADLYLLNADMSSSQFNNLAARYDFDFLIYDGELGSCLEQSGFSKGKLLSYHYLPSISGLLNTNVQEKIKLHRTSRSRIVILTGGTTGNFKIAAHQPSVFNYLNPYLTLITRLNLLRYPTAYIATPIYHGYGVAVLLMFISMGKKILIHPKFDAAIACRLIREHHVEVVTVVPLMVDKMLRQSTEDLQSLACIMSGSAGLNPKLVVETMSQLGDVLYTWCSVENNGCS